MTFDEYKSLYGDYFGYKPDKEEYKRKKKAGLVKRTRRKPLKKPIDDNEGSVKIKDFEYIKNIIDKAKKKKYKTKKQKAAIKYFEY